MKKYVFIYHVESRIEPGADANQQHADWFAAMGDKLVDGGNPFNSESEALVKNGESMHDVDTAAGYSIVMADDLDAAVEMAKGWPLLDFPGCSVKVYETMSM